MTEILIAGCDNSFSNYRSALGFCQVHSAVALNIDSISRYSGLLLPGGLDIDPALYGSGNLGSMGVDRDVDRAQLHLTHLFIQAGKPVFGICRGHQLINVYFGGTLNQNLKTADKHQQPHGDIIHNTRIKKGSILHKLFFSENLRTNSCHHQAVDIPGKNLIPVQHTSDGTIEAMFHKSLPVFCVQWHPERMMLSHAREDIPDGTPVFSYFIKLAHAH